MEELYHNKLTQMDHKMMTKKFKVMVKKWKGFYHAEMLKLRLHKLRW